MEYKTIVFKRIKNLGSYESEHLEIECDLEPGDDVNEEVDNLRKLVEKKLGLTSKNSKSAEEINGF